MFSLAPREESLRPFFVAHPFCRSKKGGALAQAPSRKLNVGGRSFSSAIQLGGNGALAPEKPVDPAAKIEEKLNGESRGSARNCVGLK